jgi:hypothetical protein
LPLVDEEPAPYNVEEQGDELSVELQLSDELGTVELLRGIEHDLRPDAWNDHADVNARHFRNIGVLTELQKDCFSIDEHYEHRNQSQCGY